MTLVIDPANAELRALKKAATWSGKRLLEIGCGDGRLTLRLASLGPTRIDAVDPDREKVRLARRNLTSAQRHLIRFGVGHAEHLRYREKTFDLVIFSWAL